MHTFVINKEFVQGTASGHHGEHRHLAISEHFQKGRAVLLDQPLQLLLNLRGLGAAVRGNTHGLGHRDKVGVLLVSVRVAVLVEQVLPLRHHTLFLVVQEENLDTNVELSSSGELGQGHVERGITVDIDDKSVRASNLGTDSSGETVSHSSKTTRGDHGTGVAPAEVLSSPHLVLTDTGSDDSTVLHVSSEIAEFLNDSLGLDGSLSSLPLIEGEGEPSLPVVDLVEPLLTLSNSLDVGQEETDVLSTVTLNSLVGLDNLVDVLGHDFEVDDATTVLRGSKLGLRGELGDVTGHTVIEASTDSDDEISLLHGHVGIGRSVHAQHVQGLGVRLVKSTQTLEGRGDRNASLVGQLLQDLGAIGASKETLTHIQDGLLGDVHKASHTVDGTLELLHAQFTGSHGRSAGEGGQGAVHRDGFTEDTGGDILGQIDEDRSGAAAGGDFESLLDATGEFSDGLDHDVPLGASTGDTDNIGFLERVGTDQAGGHLTAEDDHGSTVRKGILHGGDNVGGSRAGGDEDDTGLSRGTGVAFGHVSGALFMSREDEVEVFGVVDGIENGKNGTSRVTD